jgi:chromosome segregation ATPase
MADKSRREGPATANGLGKVTTGSKTFSVRLLKIANEFESLCKDTQGLKEYGKLFDSEASLRKDLEERNQTIMELKKERDRLQEEILETEKYQTRLTEDYNTQFKAWDMDIGRHATDSARLSQLSDELKTCRSEFMTATRATHSLREKLDIQVKQAQDYEHRVSTLKDECQMKALQLKQTQDKLETCQKNLAALKDDLGYLSIDREKM